MKKLLLTLCVAFASLCASAITIDDLCGVYTRHIDNRAPGSGMGAAIIADAQLEVTKKDETTLVFSKMFVAEGFPVEGVVDLAAGTITFAPGQQTGSMGDEGEIPQIMANSWGGTPDDDPIVGTIAADGTITLGSEDEAYAGFYVSPMPGMTIFQAQGIITFTKDNTVLWTANASYQLGDGSYVKGENVITCYNAELKGYDYGIDIATYWGKYEMKIKKNDDGTLSFFDDETNEYTAAGYFWWINWYEYANWSEYMCIYSEAGTDVCYGNATGGRISVKGEYVLYTAETEEGLEAEDLEPTIYTPAMFTITWGTPEEDAVKSVEAAKKDAAVYNIAGQRVSRPGKGIFIQNGKKYVVK